MAQGESWWMLVYIGVHGNAYTGRSGSPKHFAFAQNGAKN